MSILFLFEYFCLIKFYYVFLHNFTEISLNSTLKLLWPFLLSCDLIVILLCDVLNSLYSNCIGFLLVPSTYRICAVGTLNWLFRRPQLKTLVYPSTFILNQIWYKVNYLLEILTLQTTVKRWTYLDSGLFRRTGRFGVDGGEIKREDGTRLHLVEQSGCNQRRGLALTHHEQAWGLHHPHATTRPTCEKQSVKSSQTRTFFTF